MKTIFSTAAAVCLIASSSVGAAIQPVSASGAADSESKQVCKRGKRTGTRLGPQMCRTRAQWDAMAEASRTALKDIVDRPMVNTCGELGCHSSGTSPR